MLSSSPELTFSFPLSSFFSPTFYINEWSTSMNLSTPLSNLTRCFVLDTEEVPGKGRKIAWRLSKNMTNWCICLSWMYVWQRTKSWWCIMMRHWPDSVAKQYQFRQRITKIYHLTLKLSKRLVVNKSPQPTTESLYCNKCSTSSLKNLWTSN